ncbi:MAG: hypothetical protein JRD89_12545 [Deltaproteobacteria bacterium]|nr:hypothetical protein [Deltaproteobacteria bacterium]
MAALKVSSPPFGLKPNLFERLMKHVELWVKHDVTAKSVILCTALSAYTDEPINLFLKGESSIGKTYITMNILDYFPDEDIWKLGGLSPTALVHDYGTLVDANGNRIDENYVENRIQELIDAEGGKPSKERLKEIRRQVKKEWREILRNSHYEIDLRGKILVFLEAPHPETFMRLRPILSHDAERITYKFTDKQKGTLRTSTVVLRGWPAIICCTTEEKMTRDLATRSFTLTPETTKEKFKAGVKVIGDRKTRPWEFDKKKDELFMEYKLYIRRIRGTLKEKGWKIVIPYADKLSEVYPATVGRDMRDFDHFTSLIKMFTAFHLYIRPRIVIGESEEKEVWVLSNMEDFKLALKTFSMLEETTVTGLPGSILRFYHEVVKPMTEGGKWVEYADLVKRYNELFKEAPISDKTVYNWVDALAQVGYVTRDHHPEDRRKRIILRTYDSKKLRYYSLLKSMPFFSQEDLKKWFLAFENYSPKNKKIIYLFSRSASEQPSSFYRPETIDFEQLLNSEGQKGFVKKIFLGEYFLKREELEKELLSENKAKKSSREENRTSTAKNGVKKTFDKRLEQIVHKILHEAGGELGIIGFASRLKQLGVDYEGLRDLLPKLEREGKVLRTPDTIALGPKWRGNRS